MREPVLCLLGPPRLLTAAGERGFASDRPCQLLFYLAARADWVARDRLAELLFPDRSTVSARSNLRTVLHRAQRFDPAVGTFEANGELLRWRVPTDVAQFEAALAEGRIADAVGCYSAPLGVGLDTSGSSAFTEWLVFERARLAGRWHAAALTRLAELEPAGVLQLSERLLGADPLDEDALAARLAALCALGRDGTARKEYGAFRERLAESLGIEPSARLRELGERLRPLAPPALAPPLPAAATAATSSLVGRAIETGELRGLLANASCRVLTITGAGGVGKSRLARFAFDRLDATVADARWWIELDDLTEAAQVGARLAEAIAVELSGKAEPDALLRERLRGQRALIVFDNCEHLDGFAAWLERLSTECPSLKVLNTSRRRLSLSCEWVLPLEGLPVPDADESEFEALQTFDAVKLFDLCARHALPSFALQAHAEDVAALVRQIEGMPLAIELAAAWVRLLPVREIRREMAQSLDLLAATTERAERNRSVRASFEHSWQMLAPAERRVLAALTVLRGSFSRHAGAQIAGASLPLLAALVDKSLVRADGSGRFSLHVLIAQCAAEKLADAEACRRRHAEHYGQMLARYANLRGVDPKEALQEISAELENCRAAWHWAVAQHDAAFVERAAPALKYYFEAVGRWREGIELLEGAARAFDERDAAFRPALAGIHTALAPLQYRRGDFALAEQNARRGLKLNKLLRHRMGIKECLKTIGLGLWRRYRLDEAIRFFEQGLKLAQQDEDEKGVASFNSSIALCEKQRGAYERALPRYEQALAIWRKLGDPVGMTNVLNNIGNLHRVCKRFEAALSCFDEGLALCNTYGLVSTRVFFRINVALTCFDLDQLDRSLQLSQQARSEAHQHGEPHIETAAHLNIAQIAIKRGNMTDAQEALRAAVRMIHTTHDPTMLVSALVISGDVLLALGDRTGAMRLWRLAADYPEIDEAERADAHERLARHGGADSGTATKALPPASFDSIVQDLLAPFGDAGSASSAVQSTR